MPPRPPTRAPHSRRSLGQRFGGNFRAWARDTFSRDQMMASLKSLAWVAPLTVLIWIYAERELIFSQSVQIRVEVVNNDPNRLVQLLDADGRPQADLIINAIIFGPHSRVQQVQEKLLSSAVRIQLDPKLGEGRSAIPADILSRQPLFVQPGVSVTNVIPAKIDVLIDAVEHLDVPVRAPASMTNLDGPPIFVPAQVHISAPKSVLNAARAQGPLVAYAQLENDRNAGVRDIANVPVSLAIKDPHLLISPPAVSAKVTFRKSEIAGRIPSVPVWARYPPGTFLDKYRIDYEASVFDVQVIGPPEVIHQMNDPTFEPKPKAYFDVTLGSAGADGATHEAPLRFDFGNTGIKISPEDRNKTITFKVTERKPGE